jgi:hypothetical protein
MNFNSVKNFFLFCSGADLSILNRPECQGEQNKYAGIGSAVFFTAVFAFMSGSYALYTVFKSVWVAPLFGLIWAGFIFSLDRYIVSTLRKENGTYFGNRPLLNGMMQKIVELFKASPRIFLAIMLALVISKPLELKIFEQEIGEQLVLMGEQIKQDKEKAVRDRYDQDLTRKRLELSNYTTEIAAKEQYKNQMLDEATKESDGTGGSKIRNMGPIFRHKMDLALAAKQDFEAVKAKNQATVDTLKGYILAKEKALTTELSAMKHEPYDGLLARIAALGILTGKDQSMYWADLAIFILFMCIELAPLMFKILSDRGNYDTIQDTSEEVVRSRETERISEINDSINRRIKLRLGETQNIVSQELTSNKALMEKLATAQLSLADEIIQLWRDGELEKLKQNPTAYVKGLK